MCLSMLVVFNGCVYYDGGFRQTEGRFFDARNIEKIVDNVTTRKEAMILLGPPASVEVEEGVEVMKYHSVRTRTSRVRRFFFSRNYKQRVQEDLVLRIVSSTVVAHDFKSNLRNSSK